MKEETTQKQILVFKLVNEEFGLDILCVREVIKPREIHALPHSPAFIEGVMNLRNHIIAVIDLRRKFNIDPSKDRLMSRIIICKAGKFIVGLIVDSVSEVLSLSKGNIELTPEVISMQIEDSYVSGIVKVGGRIITLLNLEEILTKEELTGLSKAAGRNQKAEPQ